MPLAHDDPRTQRTGSKRQPARESIRQRVDRLVLPLASGMILAVGLSSMGCSDAARPIAAEPWG